MRSCMDSIKTEFIDKLQDDCLGLCIVARNGQGNWTRRSTRPTAFEQMARRCRPHHEGHAVPEDAPRV